MSIAARVVLTRPSCIATIIAGSVLLGLEIRSTIHQGRYGTAAEVLQMGFGKAEASSLVYLSFIPRSVLSPTLCQDYADLMQGPRAFISNVLWANYWQVIISTLYFLGNVLLTNYHVAYEWSRYATKRNFLRVSHPVGMQRSSYFLSLPMKYGAPYMLASTVLHWLMSQSLFIVNTKTYFGTSPDVTPLTMDVVSFITTGFSCNAILISKSFLSLCSERN